MAVADQMADVYDGIFFRPQKRTRWAKKSRKTKAGSNLWAVGRYNQ